MSRPLAVCTISALLLACVAPCVPAQSAEKSVPAAGKIVVNGAGATFPAPLYRKWIAEYAKLTPATQIDYKDVGSGEGIKRFLAGGIDFGASDAALTDEQIALAKSGATLIPTTAGMVVLAYNLPGLNGPLKLSRSTYVDLLAGRIPKWNDARIQAINPELNLPNRNIVLVARQDGSGTTYALTNHLSSTSDKWRSMGRGVGNLVSWSGSVMLARGNEGVASRIKLSEGAIGYVEYGFAKRLGMPMAHLENKAGQYVAPTAESGQAALVASLNRMPSNLRVFMPDPDGENSYPIVSLTWLLLTERYADAAKAAALKGFVRWALTTGQSYSGQIGYIPLPESLLDRARAAVEAVQ